MASGGKLNDMISDKRLDIDRTTAADDLRVISAVEMMALVRTAMEKGGLEAGYAEWDRIRGPETTDLHHERREDIIAGIWHGIANG